MAYRNLVNLGGLTAAQVWRHAKDFITSRNGIADYSASGLGWTLHDSSFAVDADTPSTGDWIVVRSPGEDGKQALYWRLEYNTVANNIIKCAAGLSWNAATNAWVSPIVSGTLYGGGGPTSGTVFSLWVYGDLDAISLVIGNGTANWGRHFGLAADTMHDQTTVLTTGAVSSGSSVVIPVASVPASWAVGRYLVIRNEATMQRVQITGIAGLNVTVASLAASYASGASVSADYSAVLSSTQFIGNAYPQISRVGTVGQVAALSVDINPYPVQAAGPDLMNNDHQTNYLWWYNASTAGAIGVYGRPKNMLGVSSVGITSGNVYVDQTGTSWRALLFANDTSAPKILFREV